MRGRKPKPRNVALREGDPGHQGIGKLKKLHASEPKAEHGLPACPRELRGVARRAWETWSEDLRTMDLDHRPDGPLLHGLCVMFARAIQADTLIRKEGIVTAGLHGVKINPAISISKSCWNQVRAFCSEFGLSPASRTRLALEKPDDSGQELMALLSMPRTPRVKPGETQ